MLSTVLLVLFAVLALAVFVLSVYGSFLMSKGMEEEIEKRGEMPDPIMQPWIIVEAFKRSARHVEDPEPEPEPPGDDAPEPDPNDLPW